MTDKLLCIYKNATGLQYEFKVRNNESRIMEENHTMISKIHEINLNSRNIISMRAAEMFGLRLQIV